MEAGKCVDAYALLKGHSCQQADAIQAYVQAKLGGTETWILIPKERWPKSWFHADGKPKYRDPVIRLVLALYGHPDAGGYWDIHAENIFMP